MEDVWFWLSMMLKMAGFVCKRVLAGKQIFTMSVFHDFVFSKDNINDPAYSRLLSIDYPVCLNGRSVGFSEVGDLTG